MCICIDANQFGNFLNQNNHPDMQPIHEWLRENNGKIVYTNEEKFAQEYSAPSGKYWMAAREYYRIGKAKFVPKQDLPTIDPNSVNSNDPHIIALCMASQTKLLLTADKDLQKDFKRLIDGGNIYQYQHRATLLTPETCPNQ